MFSLNLETKTMRIISLVLTFIGIVFILASDYVGSFAIRLAMIVCFLLCIYNFKLSYPFLSFVEKTNMWLAILGSVLVFVKPQLTMIIIGIVILVLAIPVLYKAVKKRDYSDKVMLILSSVGVLFSIYCLLNGGAALNTVITVIGIAFVIIGCLILFETFNIGRNSNKYAECKPGEHDEYRFENADEVDK